MAKPPSQNILDFTFGLIESAAIAGERCPQTVPHGPIKDSRAPGVLARAGRLRIEIFSLNWRVATILTGPHKGKSTAPCPYKGSGRPYRVIDANGASTNYAAQGMRQPSAPRLLTREELA